MAEDKETGIDKEIMKAFLGSLVRAAILLVAGALITRNTPLLGMIADYIKNNESTLVVQVTGTLLTGGALVWSMFRKWRNKRKKERAISAALALPKGASKAQLAHVLKNGLEDTLPET